MTAPSAPVLLWLRRDLRLADNAALRAALATGRPELKHLILPCQAGEPWFWDTLVDAAMVSKAAGIRLGVTYPAPLVDLAAGRNSAPQAFAALRRTA